MKEKLSFAVSVIFSLLPLIFVCFIISSEISIIVRCSDKVEGTIESYNIRVTEDEDGFEEKHYYPVYRYKYNYITYRSESLVSDRSFVKTMVGSPVTLHINPDNPREVYENIGGRLVAPIIIIVVYVVVGILFLAAFLRRKKKIRELLEKDKPLLDKK